MRIPLSTTGDPQIVRNFLQMYPNGTVVAITENISNLDRYVTSCGRFNVASVLLPPCDVFMDKIDGKPAQEYTIKYYDYLNSDICRKFIFNILAAAFLGIPVLLFFGQEEMTNDNIEFVNAICYYIRGRFGVFIALPTEVYSDADVGLRMLPNVLVALYMEQSLNVDQFLQLYPNFAPLPNDYYVINKMACDKLGRTITGQECPYFCQYFENLRRGIISQVPQQPMVFDIVPNEPEQNSIPIHPVIPMPVSKMKLL